MSTTLRAINADLAPRDIMLCKGEGYFYFAQRDDSPAPAMSTLPRSVFVYRLNQLSHADWLAASDVY